MHSSSYDHYRGKSSGGGNFRPPRRPNAGHDPVAYRAVGGPPGASVSRPTTSFFSRPADVNRPATSATTARGGPRPDPIKYIELSALVGKSTVHIELEQIFELREDGAFGGLGGNKHGAGGRNGGSVGGGRVWVPRKAAEERKKVLAEYLRLLGRPQIALSCRNFKMKPSR